ncbi:phage portal protein [Loktanella salsilacus]|uniref:phage portal protein n=1 Tax=Loktanella salsilacus TaxID=195913 RepID=UPI003704944C
MGFLNALRGTGDAGPVARVEPTVQAGPVSRPQAAIGEGASFANFNDPAVLEFMRGGMSALTQSGASVTPENAMRNTTVLRCVSLIAFAIGMLPLHLHDKATKEKATDHPLYRILHRRPNAWQTSFEFRSMMQQRALQYGGAYALKVRSGTRLIQLVPMANSRTTVRQRDDWSIEYDYQRPSGGKVTYKQADVFHIRYGLSEDGINGLALVKQAAEAIGLAQQTEKAAARLFRNGMIVGGALKHPNKLSPEAYERLKASMDDGQGADQAHKWKILEEGMSMEPAAASGKDSQALEQRKHQIEDIARSFGVPRPLLGMDDTSWGSGIDVLGQFFVRYGLNPWFEAWQQAIERDLLTEIEADQYEAKFNAGALIRGSMKDQAEFFAKALGSGGHAPWMHQDEVRDLQDMPARSDLSQGMGQPKGDGNELATTS